MTAATMSATTAVAVMSKNNGGDAATYVALDDDAPLSSSKTARLAIADCRRRRVANDGMADGDGEMNFSGDELSEMSFASSCIDVKSTSD